MHGIFKKIILPFLRVELGSATEVYYLQDLDFLLILEGVEARLIIYSLNFHIFEFFHRGWIFWDSFDKSLIGLPECQFGPTLRLTTAS